MFRMGCGTDDQRAAMARETVTQEVRWAAAAVVDAGMCERRRDAWRAAGCRREGATLRGGRVEDPFAEVWPGACRSHDGLRSTVAGRLMFKWVPPTSGALSAGQSGRSAAGSRPPVPCAPAPGSAAGRRDATFVTEGGDDPSPPAPGPSVLRPARHLALASAIPPRPAEDLEVPRRRASHDNLVRVALPPRHAASADARLAGRIYGADSSRIQPVEAARERRGRAGALRIEDSHRQPCVPGQRRRDQRLSEAARGRVGRAARRPAPRHLRPPPAGPAAITVRVSMLTVCGSCISLLICPVERQPVEVVVQRDVVAGLHDDVPVALAQEEELPARTGADPPARRLTPRRRREVGTAGARPIRGRACS